MNVIGRPRAAKSGNSDVNIRLPSHAMRYLTREAVTPADMARVLELRHRAFRPGREGPESDADRFDAQSRHLLVEDAATGRLAGCCRFRVLAGPDEIPGTYSATFYDLSRLSGFRAPMLELGRFVAGTGEAGADQLGALRAAWAALTAIVDASGVRLVFGCSSFPGTDPGAYTEAFGLLAARHLAPENWAPGPAAGTILAYAAALAGRPVDRTAALAQMPPLLRSYTAMGGWVSDHAVIDRDLGTIHVFTGLEVDRVPPGRARALRALASSLTGTASAKD